MTFSSGQAADNDDSSAIENVLYSGLNESNVQDLFNSVDLKTDGYLDIEAEEFPVDTNLLDEDYLDDFNQLLEQSVPVEHSLSDTTCSSDFIEQVVRAVKRVEEAFLAEAAAALEQNQPSFSSIIDYSACITENSKDCLAVEQARRDQNKDEIRKNEISLQIQQHEQELGGNFTLAQDLFNRTTEQQQDSDQPTNHNEEERYEFGLLVKPEYDFVDNPQPLVFRDDGNSKDFSSWFCLDSDDEDALVSLKTKLSTEEFMQTFETNDEKQAPSAADQEQQIAAMGSAGIKEPLASEQVTSRHKEWSPEPMIARQVADDQQNAIHVSNNDDQRQPLFITSTKDNFSGDDDHDLEFEDLIVKTSTPNSESCLSFINNQANLERIPVRETRRSKYFLRNSVDISITQEKNPSL